MDVISAVFGVKRKVICHFKTTLFFIIICTKSTAAVPVLMVCVFFSTSGEQILTLRRDSSMADSRALSLSFFRKPCEGGRGMEGGEDAE